MDVDKIVVRNEAVAIEVGGGAFVPVEKSNLSEIIEIKTCNKYTQKNELK